MPSSLEDKIYNSLRKVIDPDFKKDLVSLNMIDDLTIDGKNNVSFAIALTTPVCPVKDFFKQECIQYLRADNPQIRKIHIDFTVQKKKKKSHFFSQVHHAVVVASGKGGVGKSLVAANLAIALKNMGARIGILDADIYGPSVPTIFHTEGSYPGVKKVGNKNYLIPIAKQGIKMLSMGYLAKPQQAVIWRGPMASSAIKQFLLDTDWGELDYLIIDLPPGTGDIHLSICQNVSLSGALIVTTPQKIALIDAVKAVQMFQQKHIRVPILGVIENMSYFSPPKTSEEKYYLFGKDGGKRLASQYEIPFLGEIPIDTPMREAADAGTLLENFTKSDKNTTFTKISEQLVRNIAKLSSS